MHKVITVRCHSGKWWNTGQQKYMFVGLPHYISDFFTSVEFILRKMRVKNGRLY